MSTSKVKKIVQKYRDLLDEQNIAFSCIYIYGSYARGNPHEHSDIDVAVVLKRTGKNFFEKQMHLRELAPQIDARIEPLLLAEKDFRPGNLSIMAHEVKKHGIKIQ